MEKKTIEEIKAAVLAECERLTHDFGHETKIYPLHRSYFEDERPKISIYKTLIPMRESSDCYVVDVFGKQHVLSDSMANPNEELWLHIYRLLGLEAAEAVAALSLSVDNRNREIGELQIALNIEKARSAKLVESLDTLVNHIGNTQFMYKRYLDSKDEANRFNLSDSIGKLGRAKTKYQKGGNEA